MEQLYYYSGGGRGCQGVGGNFSGSLRGIGGLVRVLGGLVQGEGRRPGDAEHRRRRAEPAEPPEGRRPAAGACGFCGFWVGTGAFSEGWCGFSGSLCGFSEGWCRGRAAGPAMRSIADGGRSPPSRPEGGGLRPYFAVFANFNVGSVQLHRDGAAVGEDDADTVGQADGLLPFPGQPAVFDAHVVGAVAGDKGDAVIFYLK